MVTTLTPKPGFTAVIEQGPCGWSAEMRIADSLVGGWDHIAGIQLRLVGVRSELGSWPVSSSSAQPSSWASAIFGTVESGPGSVENHKPIANAGSVQILTLSESDTVHLDGSGSVDPDGDALVYDWTQIDGPLVPLSNDGDMNPSFMVDLEQSVTAYRFSLVVSDGDLLSDPSEVLVVVVPFEASLPDPTTGDPVDGDFIRGDAVPDGAVDITDALVTLGFLFLGEGEILCQDAADSDDSGLVDITDPLRTLCVLFLGDMEIPAPGLDNCGLDPTEDALGCDMHSPCE